MARLQVAAIAVDELIRSVAEDRDGALAIFLGTVRDHNEGRRVLYIDYDAYAPMAERELERVETDAAARFDVSRVAIVHRVGRLEIGEISVAVAVAAPHRAAALEACRFAIDRLKATVPIWKKEVFEGGEIWIEGP